MLLHHGRASSVIRDKLAEWALWLANTSPPWAAYRAMCQGHLVDTENTSMPSPVAAPMSIEDPTVLLLANADNGFNILSHYVMLWEARHC
ncbi:hypothetical protein ACHAW6_003943 [Cyclotella cf. meneghiniana]